MKNGKPVISFVGMFLGGIFLMAVGVGIVVTISSLLDVVYWKILVISIAFSLAAFFFTAGCRAIGEAFNGVDKEEVSTAPTTNITIQNNTSESEESVG